MTNRFECDKCFKILTTRCGFRRHKCPLLIRGARVNCEICARSFANEESLGSHTRRYHTDEKVENQSTEIKSELMDEKSPLHVPRWNLHTVDQTTQTSVRDECKARIFEFMWRGLSNKGSTPYGMLDVYRIKKRFFQNLHSFFNFKLEIMLSEGEQALVGAILETNNLGECRDILNENLDIFVDILTKANVWFE